MTIGVLSNRVLITDRGFKAASWTLENENGNVQVTLKLNLTFGTIGNATVDKMTPSILLLLLATSPLNEISLTANIFPDSILLL